MSCVPTSSGRTINADLIDLLSDNSAAAQLLSNGAVLPCAFPTAALLALACLALTLHTTLLLASSVQLGRLVLRYRSSHVERWWSTWAGRYFVLMLLESGCAVLFCSLRLAGLSGHLTADSSSTLLAVSFSPRAGATYGMSVLLYMMAVTVNAATQHSVNNTVQAALHTARLVSPTLAARAPWHIRHFSSISLGLVAWHAAVWSTLFLLPTAARSSSPAKAQQAIALILVSLGNVSYWYLARAVTIATRGLSHMLTVDDPNAAKPLREESHCGPLNRVQPSPASPKSPTVVHVGASSGLSSAQVDSRNRAGGEFSLASTVIRYMLFAHFTVSAAFFACILALPSQYLQAYWLYFQLSYWALFVLLRVYTIKLPQPKH